MFCSNLLILVIFPIIFQVLRRRKINLFWFYDGDKPVTVCAFVHVLESCHLNLCIVKAIILSYYSVCQNYSLWLPMTITVASFLTMHSLTVWTYFLLIWLHCIHNVNGHFILINPTSRWNTITYICIILVAQWCEFAYLQRRTELTTQLRIGVWRLGFLSL